MGFCVQAIYGVQKRHNQGFSSIGMENAFTPGFLGVKVDGTEKMELPAGAAGGLFPF